MLPRTRIRFRNSDVPTVVKAPKPRKQPRPRKESPFDAILAEYGDLLFDLSHRSVPPHHHPNQVFRSILRDLKHSSAKGFDRYRRAWILGTAARRIISLGRAEPGREPADPLLYSSSASTAKGRLEHLARYFQRLSPESRLVLLFRDRYDVGLDECAAILGMPALSLELIHRQALETLASWIWQDDTHGGSAVAEKLKAWERTPLPEEIRKAPLSSIHVTAAGPSGTAPERTPWQKTPWFIRSGAEALGLAVVILAVVALVPKIRQVYERSLEEQLATYRAEDLRLGEVQTEQQALEVQEEGEAEETAEAPPAAEPSAEEAAEKGKKPVKMEVGASEICRFNIKSSSPAELRPKIVQMLLELQVPPETKGIQGIEAPGGIQFNLMIPKDIVPQIKTRLEK
ncbi:MAG TPA: hypothetical protein VL588_02095, partial [Bdellovibrionota bacterium]|nr:hypothetical protein [Bdellovibrionota bacterium]